MTDLAAIGATVYSLASLATGVLVWRALFAAVNPERITRRTRVTVAMLVVVLGVLWPSTLLLGAIASTDRGLAWLYDLAGVDEKDRT